MNQEKTSDEGVPKELVTEVQKKAIKELILGETWGEKLYKEFSEPYMIQLSNFIQKERKNKTIYPPKEDVFNAYKLTPLDKVKIVIIGQDPYIKEGEAHGLSFSVKKGVKTPPSLEKIFTAIEKSFYDGFKLDQDTDLTRWADQGIFLLNSVLTVEKGKSNSHKGRGWETFTDITIETLNKEDRKICFLLFGKDAQNKCYKVDRNKHLVIEVEHPAASAYQNRDWEYNDCFKRASEFVEENYQTKIIW